MHNIELPQLQGNKLECLVNRYDYSKMLTDKQGRKFMERISKEVWEKAIASNPDIKIFLNHKDYFSIGSNIQIVASDDGIILTLELDEKEMGLYQAAQENRLSGCSFSFRCLDENIQDRESYYVREVLEMELHEISLLDVTPAYNNTEIEARNHNLFKNKLLLKEIELLSIA